MHRLLTRIITHPALPYAAIACWVIIVVLSLLPGTARPHTGASGRLEHMAAYAGTAFLSQLSLPRLQGWRLLALATTLAAAGEIAQIWIPGRASSLLDWVASSCGAGLGYACALVFVALLARLPRE